MTANKAVASAGIVTVGVGSVNAIANHKTLPSTKFLLGCGVSFFVLSLLAESGMEELAQALAFAVMTTVILGEGNGVLSWIDGKGEVDTQRPKVANVRRAEHAQNSTADDAVIDIAAIRSLAYSDSTTPYPGIPAA